MIDVAKFMGRSDCQLLKPFPIFMAVYQATGGDPCTTGCAYYNNGKCPAYVALTNPPVTVSSPQGETVREAALRLGVSISEVRRRRKAK